MEDWVSTKEGKNLWSMYSSNHMCTRVLPLPAVSLKKKSFNITSLIFAIYKMQESVWGHKSSDLCVEVQQLFSQPLQAPALSNSDVTVTSLLLLSV